DTHSRHRFDKVASHIRLPKSIFNQRQKLSHSATAYYNTQSEIVRQPTTTVFLTLISLVPLRVVVKNSARRHRDRALKNKRVLWLFQPRSPRVSIGEFTAVRCSNKRAPQRKAEGT